MWLALSSSKDCVPSWWRWLVQASWAASRLRELKVEHLRSQQMLPYFYLEGAEFDNWRCVLPAARAPSSHYIGLHTEWKESTLGTEIIALSETFGWSWVAPRVEIPCLSIGSSQTTAMSGFWVQTTRKEENDAGNARLCIHCFEERVWCFSYRLTVCHRKTGSIGRLCGKGCSTATGTIRKVHHEKSLARSMTKIQTIHTFFFKPSGKPDRHLARRGWDGTKEGKPREVWTSQPS